MKKLCLFVLVLGISFGLHAQIKSRLAVLPFTGGEGRDGETIAMLLSYQPDIANVFTLIPWTANADRIRAEQAATPTGLTDSGTIAALGRGLDADYMVAGHIQKLGDRNLLLITIVNVQELQQIAGDYREYKTLEDISDLLPDMAKKIVSTMGIDTASLPKLAVLPFTILDDQVNQSDADVLMQILVTEIANCGKYAVIPHNRNTIREEMRKNHIEVPVSIDGRDPVSIKAIGKAINVPYVLVGDARSLGNINMFMVSIINTADTSQIAGNYVTYLSVTDGLNLMGELSFKLTGIRSSSTIKLMPENFVKIAAGTFFMGSPDEEVGRDADEATLQVTVKGFYIGKYEVTQQEYQEVMRTNPSNFKGTTLPVEQVSWYEAVEYCNKRSERDGLVPVYTINKTRSDPNNISEYDTNRWLVTWDKAANGYRLPTEAEWEYACRAGSGTPYHTGANITTSLANFDGNNPYNGGTKGIYREKTTPVGNFPPNALGLYDMHGNVREWCWDWYGAYDSAAADPTGANIGAYRITRGGSWYYGAVHLRSAYRDGYTPSYRNYYVGFRIVRSDLN
ncbi:MAG: formylglycine-generating enzyme family protein [Treponema sp.]|jgi:formylglycine-generating enzyme required for sulfatase activity/TolB-like protein|nr:formylglycine-generating enzyme family protein [Treponema sp.]